MATLQGSWLIGPEGRVFFLWAQTWRDLAEIPSSIPDSMPLHPFCLPWDELLLLIRSLHPETFGQWQASPRRETITLPSHRQKKASFPLLAHQDCHLFLPKSLHFQTWQVEGLALDPAMAAQLLRRVPLGHTDSKQWGSGLIFFAQLYRWSLDLLVRGKFLPGFNTCKDGAGLGWYPLLDSTQDQSRLARFSQRIPANCLAYGEQEKSSAQELILDFLQSMVQAQITGRYPSRTGSKDPWLPLLVSASRDLEKQDPRGEQLRTALAHWQFPVQSYLAHRHNRELEQRQFRVAMILEPPADKSTETWRLSYTLQALDSEALHIPAQVIWQTETNPLLWQDRVVASPQESLLRGLGVASLLYEPIAMSLESRSPTGCDLDPIQAYAFIQSMAWQLQDSGLGVVLPPGLRGTRQHQRLGVKIQSKVQPKTGDRLTLKSLINYQLQLVLADAPISNQDFQNLLAQRSPLVEINGQWLMLQPADVRAAQEILQQQQTPMTLSVEDALRLAVGETQTMGKLPVVKFEASGVLQELMDTLRNPQGVKPMAEPPGFKGSLRPYQARGVGWLAFLERWGLGACLADDMGLGKTPQLLAFLLSLQAEEMLERPVLVVCPTSVISNWFHEVEKFAPGLKTMIHHGDRRKKGQPLLRAVQGQQLVITSYSLLHRDLSSLKLVPWQGIVLDEAQNIKNAEAKQSQAVRQLRAGFRIALTGTPVENRLTELWSILDFLNPGFLGSRAYFQRRFATPIEKFGDHQSLYALRSLVRPFILRRLKTDQTIIQDLPEKQEMTVFCGLSRRQADLYQHLVEQSLAEIEDSQGIQRHGLILTLLMQLKQLCNHPAQFLKETSLSDPQSSGKLLRLEEMLEEVITEGDRALIFTQFAAWGHLLQPYLQQRFGQEVLYLYGGLSRAKRQALIDRFQNDPDAPQLFILSLKAGGTGLNLTRANHVFHVDRWWNPAVENQATDRAFRIGQTRNVQVHKFVCTGTLEEKIHNLLESKQQLAEQTVDAGENWLTQLDTDQLRNLLLLDRQSIIDEES